MRAFVSNVEPQKLLDAISKIREGILGEVALPIGQSEHVQAYKYQDGSFTLHHFKEGNWNHLLIDSTGRVKDSCFSSAGPMNFYLREDRIVPKVLPQLYASPSRLNLAKLIAAIETKPAESRSDTTSLDELSFRRAPGLTLTERELDILGEALNTLLPGEGTRRVGDYMIERGPNRFVGATGNDVDFQITRNDREIVAKVFRMLEDGKGYFHSGRVLEKACLDAILEAARKN